MKSEKDGRSNKQVIKNKVENSSKVIKNEDTGIVHTIKHSEQLAFSKWINE
jgi:hypothetical protein